MDSSHGIPDVKDAMHTEKRDDNVSPDCFTPPSCDMSTHTPLYRVRIRRSPDTTTSLNPVAPVFPPLPHQPQHAGPRVWGHLLRSLEAQVAHHRTRSESPPRQHEAALGYPHCHIHTHLPLVIAPVPKEPEAIQL